MLCCGYVSFSKGKQVLFLIYLFGTTAGQNEVEIEFPFYCNTLYVTMCFLKDP